MSLPNSLMTSDVMSARDAIERALDENLSLDSGCPDRLREAMRYSVLSPGKRLRPLLVMASTRLCGGEDANALPAACAVEFIHCYSLVHDDLPAMDDDDLRRGRPTTHKQFDEATAILAGDALIPLAFEVMSRDIQPEATAARCCLELARASGASHLVGGQADDLAAENGECDLQMLERIHLRKTAAMLAVSLKLGAICAHSSEENISRLERFGKNLGLAFQISDDLLDLRGEQDKMGKRVGKDQSKGKLTYPSALGIERSEQLANQLVADAVNSLESFGSRAQPLVDLAQFVVSRTR
ncbi:MAG: polyprenyl synthetase family protein [Pirellulaceae bacterium]